MFPWMLSIFLSIYLSLVVIFENTCHRSSVLPGWRSVWGMHVFKFGISLPQHPYVKHSSPPQAYWFLLILNFRWSLHISLYTDMSGTRNFVGFTEAYNRESVIVGYLRKSPALYMSSVWIWNDIAISLNLHCLGLSKHKLTGYCYSPKKKSIKIVHTVLHTHVVKSIFTDFYSLSQLPF